MPVTVRNLGAARFGLLALAWAVAEGSGMFDLGMGRATVRYVADATERGIERIRDVAVASVAMQFATGLLAGILLFALSGVLARRAFTISPALQPEAIAMFHVLGLHIPVMLGTAALRACLEGAHRFDLSTSLRIPSSVSSVAIPAIVASLGGSLPTIMWLLLAVRIGLLVASAVAVRRALLRDQPIGRISFATLREMLGYSGWVAVSMALSPPLASFDRFAVGSVVGVAGLGLYTGASEAANRFLMIPATAFSALLPTLSATDAKGERGRSFKFTHAAARQLAAVLLPMCLVLLVFGPAILRVWLGPDFGRTAGPALRVLSIGVFFGGLAHLPLALLYGSGRPDLPTKIHIGQVIVYIPLILALVHAWGLTGAAMGWALRCTSDLILYDYATKRFLGHYSAGTEESVRRRWLTVFAILLTGAFLIAARLGDRSQWIGLGVVLLALVAYAIVVWVKVYGPEERVAWLALVHRRGR